jgi:hypothetical protein
MKLHTKPEPIANDGARAIGAITGVIAGASFALWMLPSSVSKVGIFVVLALLSGATLGFIVGFTVGRIVDVRLEPKLQQAILNYANKATRQSHQNKL